MWKKAGKVGAVFLLTFLKVFLSRYLNNLNSQNNMPINRLLMKSTGMQVNLSKSDDFRSIHKCNITVNLWLCDF